MNSADYLAEYQAKAAKFAMYPKEKGIEYTLLGALVEFMEFQEAKPEGAVDELGDVLWYLVMLANELGVKLSMLRLFHDASHSDLATELLSLASMGQKYMRIGKLYRHEAGEDGKCFQADARANLFRALLALASEAEDLRTTLERVGERNIQKLSKRHGEKP